MKHQRAILEHLYLFKNPISNTDIAKGIDESKSQVMIDLKGLKDIGLIQATNGGQNYFITDKGKNYCVINYGLEPSDKVIDIENPLLDKKEPDVVCSVDIEKAFNSLQYTLHKKNIENIQLKLNVLKRLSNMMDDSIATVLDSIASDLKAV